MSKISDATGSRFERIISEYFKDLKNISDFEHQKPDFEHPNFYIEAKTAYQEFSAQITLPQLEKFPNLDKPTIYLIGFHNFDRAFQRLSRFKKKTSIDKKMDLEMQVHNFYFFNIEIIRSIFEKHIMNRSKTKEISAYLQERHFHQIFENREIKRRGIKYLAKQYYNATSKTLIYDRNLEFKDKRISYILDSKTDRVVLDYIDSLTIPF